MVPWCHCQKTQIPAMFNVHNPAQFLRSSPRGELVDELTACVKCFLVIWAFTVYVVVPLIMK